VSDTFCQITAGGLPVLTGHRRYLLREATGPSAGEVEAGEVNVLVGAFSDAQMYEDPWTDDAPKWDPTSWEPASLARASARPYKRAIRGEAIPYMIGAVKVGTLDTAGDLRMSPQWTGQDRETWEPRGIGDFRSSEIYTDKSRRHYLGEAIPFMVGDMDVGYGDPWEPHGIGDPPAGPYGEALPYAVGGDDEAGLFGSKKRKARREAEKAAAAESEGLVYLGRLG
jgi:hypothetical protein